MTKSANFLSRPLLGGRVNFPVCLAPMVGLSHVALRLLVRRYLPAGAVTLWPTEMLSSWRLPREAVGFTPETLRAPEESELVPQILGNEEEPIAQSVRRLSAWGACAVDINMGCPVRKALQHNYGVALMGDPEYAASVVRMTVRASELPVSVKLRAGLQNDLPFLLRFVRGLEAAGASWVTLHPRVGHMKRRGTADWSQIRRVREEVGMALIGNGDVQCLEDVFRLGEVSGCDAVMVGRALAARPWLMWQVGETLGFPPPMDFTDRRAPREPLEEGAEYGEALLFLLDALIRHFTWDEALKRFKFHLRMTAGWLEWGQNLHSLAARAPSFEELRSDISEFFSVPQKMCARTQLRE